VATVSAPEVASRLWYLPPAVVLVGANLMPVYGVLVLDWSVLALLSLFWLELFIAGPLAVLGAVLARRISWRGKATWALAFSLFYGALVIGLGIMIYSFFGHLEGVQAFDDGLLPIAATLTMLEKHGFRQMLTALWASHLFSFLWNYLGRGEFRDATLKALTWQANSKVFMLFFALFFGSLLMMIGSPAWGIVILIGFKLWSDLSEYLSRVPRVI
jgi:hypothetical protein